MESDAHGSRRMDVRVVNKRLSCASARRVGASLLLLCALSSRISAFPSQDEKWIRVRTKHFAIASNADEAVATRIGVQLERFRAVVERHEQGSNERSRLPTTILVFKNELSFRPYKPTHDGKPDDRAGWVMPTR